MRRTKTLRRVIGLFLLGLVAHRSEAEPLPPGVFALAQPNPIRGQQPVIKGTAFLVSAEGGIFLTAAHVLTDCGIHKPNENALLLWRSFYSTPAGNELVTENIRLRIVASGFDVNATDGSYISLPETMKDWAALELVDTGDRQYFGGFSPIAMNRDQNKGTLLRSAKQAEKLQIIGFPLGVTDARPAPAQLGLEDPNGGLWLAEGPAEEGNSGGPCFGGGPGAYSLVGIVLRKAEVNNRSYHQVLPTFAFIKQLSGHLPSSLRVQKVVSLLRSATTSGDPSEGRKAVFLTITQMDGLDHWRLVDELCADKTIIPSVLSEFIVNFYYSYAESAFVFGELAKCRPDLRDELFKKMDEVADGVRSGRAPSVGDVRFATAFGEFLLDPEERPSSIDGVDFSRVLVDYAYVAEYNIDPFKQSDSGIRALALALEQDPNNKEIPGATAMSAKAVPTEYRRLLTTSEIQIHQSESELVFLPEQNKLLFDRVWGTSGTGVTLEVKDGAKYLNVSDKRKSKLTSAILRAIQAQNYSGERLNSNLLAE